MDMFKEFEEYLPRWSEEKMQPMPTKEHPDRWSIAWKDFVNEVLTPRREELVADYLAMKFKTKGDAMKKEVKEDVVETSSVEEPVKELSEWEKVQALLKKNSWLLKGVCYNIGSSL